MRPNSSSARSLILFAALASALCAAPQASANLRVRQLTRAVASRASKLLHRGSRRTPVALNSKLRKQLANQAADRHIGRVLDYSRKNGIYYVGSDVHIGNGDAREDFDRKGRIPAQTLRWLTDAPQHRGKHVTLVLAGDTLDIMEHVRPGAGLRQQKRAVSSFVEAHRDDWTALAHAVVHRGLRVVLGIGNHDMHLVDVRLRKHFLNQIATAAGLSPKERATLHRRVAYSGHAIPYGSRGEAVSVHAHAPDAFNSYSSPINPYTGDRKQEINVGNLVVQDWYIKRELEQTKGGRGLTNIGTYLTPKALWQMGKLVHKATAMTPAKSPKTRAAKAAHDRYAMEQWVERTGFHRAMDGEAAGAASVQRWTNRWLAHYEGMPTPLHDAMSSRLRVLNLGTVLLSTLRMGKSVRKEIGDITAMKGRVGQVRAVTGGHDHRFYSSVQRRAGEAAGSWVSFNDTGTMTVPGKGTLVRIETDARGHVAAPPASLWVDRETGAATVAVPAKHDKPRWKVPGWQRSRRADD